MKATLFTQKKSCYRTRFEFGEEELTYTFANARNRVGSTVAYHKVPDRMNYREMKRWWLPYAAIFYGSVCIITGECYADSNNIAMLYGSIYFLTLLFLGISLAALHYHAGGMTSIPLNPPILVLHDAKGPVIIAEIMKRRQEMMKAKLARVDFNRPYYEEAGKFSWLREEGIISEQEYRAARQKIAAMRDKAALSPHGGPASVN